MEREEAIERLNIHKSTSVFVDSIAEAIDMAIEALQFAEHFDLLKEFQSLQEVVRCKDCRHRDLFSCPLADNDFQKDEDFCSWGERREPMFPTFAESAEAYKAWTGEEMGKTGDEINEMNKEIIKDILKMMPTAYLLEALGVSTFEELTEQADRPHGEWEDGKWCSICGCGIPTDVWGGGLSEEEAHYCVNCGAEMGGDEE